MAQVFIPYWIHCWITAKQNNEYYHYNYSYRSLLHTYNDADLLAFATAWYNVVAPGLAAVMPSNVLLISATARDMFNSSAHEAVYVPSTPSVGTVAGDPEPASLCGVLSIIPATVGKGVRGRMFVSPFAEGSIVNQVIGTSTVAALTTLGAALRTFAGTGAIGVQPVIASRKHELLRDVVATVASAQVNNQIRRLIGHRRHKRQHLTP